MYRVMIMDDEQSLRNLLKVVVDWESFNMEIVGEATSGIEGINTIDILQPDIAFVDIQMPFMNGIEFSRIAMKRYPKLKVVILTAFDEFEYARECIRIGVDEYLLKPIARADIIKVCKNITAELDARPKEEEEDFYYQPRDMKVIQEYIQCHYKNPELNLTYIAEKFGFNPSYFSRKFKSEMNVNLLEYIMQCRMEHALGCVKKKKPMYATAKEVGIPDPNYFGKCFKRYTGESYSEVLKKGNEKRDSI